MKLSTKGRYAVMAMADLADAAEAGPVTLSDIASRQSISLSYLEQLFAKLRRADIVSSVRGRAVVTGSVERPAKSGFPTSSWLWTSLCARLAAPRPRGV